MSDDVTPPLPRNVTRLSSSGGNYTVYHVDIRIKDILVSDDVMVRANEFAARMEAAVTAAGMTWFPPNVSTCAGEVFLEWWKGRKYLLVRLDTRGAPEFTVLGFDEDAGDVDYFDDVFAMWRWLHE